MRRLLLPALLGLAACTGPTATTQAAGTGSALDSNAPVYPSNLAHSPLTDDVIANLQATIAKSGRDVSRFSKLGDSMTVDDDFAKCFAKDAVSADVETADPGDDQSSLEATRQYFIQDQIGSTTSFDRVSLSATIGWMAMKAVQNIPNSPLDKEIAATNAAFAVVMYGANDTEPGSVPRFTKSMTTIVQRLLSLGVVPLLSTIPPEADESVNSLVPGMNAAIRSVAEQNRVPLMDLWMKMDPLPKYGLGPDGLHPSASGDGCTFTASAMNHGYNWRNLLLIEELDRMRNQILNGAPAPTGGQDGGTDPSTTDGGTDPGTTPDDGAGTCFSATLQTNINNGECVQSSTNGEWYQCVAGEGWVEETSSGEGPLGACTAEHSL